MPNLDTAFSALADPIRRAILANLASGEATMRTGRAIRGNAARHLATEVLEGAGLIVRRVEARSAPAGWHQPVLVGSIDGVLGGLGA